MTTDLTQDGDVIVHAAVNSATGELEGACLPHHIDYHRWRAAIEYAGHTVFETTIGVLAEMLEREPRLTLTLNTNCGSGKGIP